MRSGLVYTRGKSLQGPHVQPQTAAPVRSLYLAMNVQVVGGGLVPLRVLNTHGLHTYHCYMRAPNPREANTSTPLVQSPLLRTSAWQDRS